MTNKRLYLDEEIISRDDLKALLEYSCTTPTRATIGLRWRCASLGASRFDQENTEWLIKTYVQDPHRGNNALIAVVWAVSEPGVPHKGDLRD